MLKPTVYKLYRYIEAVEKNILTFLMLNES
jgi:hypothetical protein